jgi:hypothetical protein
MYRTVDCATWDDPWFAELAPNAKLLFLYLLTNRRATACGVFEISARAIAFETGLDAAAVKPALAALSPKIQWWPDLQVIWVRNFFKRQRANSNAVKFTQSARTALGGFPACIQMAVGSVYPELVENGTPPDGNGVARDRVSIHIPMDTLSNGYQEAPPSHRDKETVTVTDQNNKNNAHADTREETAPAVSLAEPAPPDPAWDAIDPAANHALPSKPLHPTPKPSGDAATIAAFRTCHEVYPLRHGATANWDLGLAEYALIPVGDRPAVERGIRHFAQHPDALKEGGEYVPQMPKFLAERRWTQYQTPPVSGKAPRAAPPPVELSPYQQRQAEKRRAAASGVASA